MKKLFTILSIVLFVLSIIPLIGLTKWGNGIFVAVLEISLFLPLCFGFIGFVFALFGVKGKTRLSLILLHIFGVCLNLFLIFIAVYGFQQP
ncbi:hypothetical protein N782_09760 [Pontibacillus yanchengensis Y32]|uniref:ABC transporter permease n=1 Tax=Pontibacillus yanchengensis Y32 TaxID=1385514 RepID=A0A0A2TEQ1_9BACI|nr:hypothetical protein N782_09760 [Pontibacillus yanchengensis Y32]